MTNLACVLVSLKKFTESEALNTQCLAIRKKLLGNDHPDVLLSMNNLADCIQCQGAHRYKEAEEILKQCNAKYLMKLGQDHPETIHAMSNFAHCLDLQHRYKESEPIHKQCYEKRKVLFGENHSITLQSKNYLVKNLLNQQY